MAKKRNGRIELFSIPCSIFFFIFFLFLFTPVQAEELADELEDIKGSEKEEEFDPNNIISDAQMLDHSTMSTQDIQNFLEEQGSFLASYHVEDTYGEIRSAAEIIYNATNRNFNCSQEEMEKDSERPEGEKKCQPITTINPKVILVLLQKEQSLISSQNPSQRRLDWATGYAVPDSGNRNYYFEGFGRQVNSAALQFRAYMNNPEYYNYKKGETYEFKNNYSSKDVSVVTPANKATAALYNYTPHVYYGNYNFYFFWKKYFGEEEREQKYPDRSLLQVEGEPGVWLIEDGKKRPFHSMSALKSRFDTNKIIKVKQEDLLSYETGVPIKLSNYSIIRSPAGDLYLLVDNKKRPFSSYDVFTNIGFNPEEVINANWQTVRSYELGEEITKDSAYPTGALLQNQENGGIYWVYSGEKRPLIHPIFLETMFEGERVISVSPQVLEDYERSEPIKFESGELLKSSDSPAVHLISGEKRRAFTSGEIFEKLGYRWENIINVPQAVINLYEKGEVISK